MPQQTTARVLEAWRRGERLLDQLSPVDPDHETVALAVARLRAAYHSLTRRTVRSIDVLDRSNAVVSETTSLLDRVEERLRNRREAI